MHKRQSFQHEREVRALHQDMPTAVPEGGYMLHNPKAGKHIAVDLAALIQGVRIAPGAPDWLLELTKSVVRRFDKPWQVQRSELDTSPLF